MLYSAYWSRKDNISRGIIYTILKVLAHLFLCIWYKLEKLIQDVACFCTWAKALVGVSDRVTLHWGVTNLWVMACWRRSGWNSILGGGQFSWEYIRVESHHELQRAKRLNHLRKSWMWAGMSFCVFIKPATHARLGAFWNLDFLNMSLWVSKLLRCQSHNFLQSQLLWNSTLIKLQTPWHQNFYQGTGIQKKICNISSQISHSRRASGWGSFWFLCFVPDWLNEFVFVQWSKEQPWSSRLFSSFCSSPARAWVSHRVSTSTLDSHLDCKSSLGLIKAYF